MPGAVMGRRERKKLQSKQAILAAAVKKFTVKGVRGTSIADIMREAGLGLGTFYNYFASKEALLLCLLEEIVEEAGTLAARRMEESAPAAGALEEVVALTAGKLDASRFVLPLFLRASDRSALPRATREGGPRPAPAFRSVFSGLVRYGQARKEFRKDIPAPIVTELFHSIFQAASFSSLDVAFTENVRMKTNLLLSGLQPRK